MQQRDQPRPGLVFNATFVCDPGADFTRRARQRRGDPGFQGVLLRYCQPATATLVAEARKAIDAIFLIQLIPSPNRVVVHKQYLDHCLATHAAIQQQKRVRPARQTVSHRPIPSQVNQVLPRFRVQEIATDHERIRIAVHQIRKSEARVLVESGYRLHAACRRRGHGGV